MAARQPTASGIEPLAYSIHETARMLGLSRDTIHRLIRRGDLARVKVGSRTLIPSRSIHELLDEGEAPV